MFEKGFSGRNLPYFRPGDAELGGSQPRLACALSRDLGAAQSFAAIAQGLGDVDAADAFLSVEIGKRAGDAERPVIAPRAQSERFRGVTQKSKPAGLRCCDLLEHDPVAFGIGAEARLTERSIAIGLDAASGGDPQRPAAARGRRPRPRAPRSGGRCGRAWDP